MYKIILTSLGIFILFGLTNQQKYKFDLIQTVIKNVPGASKKVRVAVLNKSNISKLNEPLKALAAYYSALGGFNCDGNKCELTSALGLGNQGSKQHKALIQKWFPNDTLAKKLITQDCFQSSNGSSDFTNYSALSFILNKDTVTINLTIIHFSDGGSSREKEQNKALIKEHEIIMISR